MAMLIYFSIERIRFHFSCYIKLPGVPEDLEDQAHLEDPLCQGFRDLGNKENLVIRTNRGLHATSVPEPR